MGRVALRSGNDATAETAESLWARSRGRESPSSESASSRFLSSSAYPIRTLAALGWLFWSSRLFVEIGTFPTAAVWSILFGAGAITLLTLYALLRSERATRVLDDILVFGTLLIGVIWVVALIYGNPNYGTDEAALVQGAAQTLVHGHNPYGVNLGWTLQHFGVQPSSYTYTITGHSITQIDYPALSFLPEAALIGLGFSNQVTIWVCAAFLAISGVVLFMVVPRAFRPLIALLLGFNAYFNAAASGLIFTQMMVFTLIAIVSWEDWAGHRSGWWRWVSPVAMGLAVSVQQDSWFLVPCFMVAAYQEGRLRRARPWSEMLRYAAVVFLTFAASNAPFVVGHPTAWIRGVTKPLSLPLMPLGQGLIGLTTYLGVGGGNLSLYSVTSILVFATLLLVIGFQYRRARYLVVLSPAIVLWFSTRSLEQYALIAAYALLAAMCCWRGDTSASVDVVAPARRHVRARRAVPSHVRVLGGMSVRGVVAIGLGTMASVGTFVLALTTAPPLTIEIVSYHSTGQEQTIDSLQIGVTNHTDRAMRPVFVVEDGPYIGTPWIWVGADRTIPSHSSRTVKVLAPNTAVMPSLNSTVTVDAFTSAPAAVSISRSVLPNQYHTLLLPLDSPGPFPPGKTVTMTVHVLNRLGGPVHRAGIAVQLGQAAYSAQGLFPTENSINGSAEGQSPVGARTNALGIATFKVRAVQVQSRATTLQAWLGTSGASGYSNRVIVWFGYPGAAAGP